MTFGLADRKIETDLDAFVMGIVNATGDSFWEESRGGAEIALSMVAEGADIIDIGGESTRPGAEYVDSETEISRIVPVIEEIRRNSDVPISVDTRKLDVMRAAFDAGADILNDVSALEDDPGLARFAAEKEIPVILMHKRGIPSRMQDDTEYSDVFSEVDSYLSRRAEFAVSVGISPEKIVVDPGIGFGKDFSGNFELMKKCGMLCSGRFPVLMALSRKSCIGQATGRDVSGRLCGTLCANLLSVLRGASLLRVHDVGECVDSLKILRAFGGKDVS